MELKAKFNVTYMEEALVFLESLPEKVKDKIASTYPRADILWTRNYSKNSTMKYGLTQEQLGELMGVQRAQVSRIERGHNLTIGTIVRAFKAMGVPAAFSFGGVSLSLC